MNYFEFLNKKISAAGMPAGYTVYPYYTQGNNPFASTPVFGNRNENVVINGVSIFTSASKEEIAKIDYDKVLKGNSQTYNIQLTPLEYVLKEFFSLDEVKKDADKNGDGEVSVYEARNYVNELAQKDGDNEILSLQDFEKLIKEKGINLEKISDFLDTVRKMQQNQETQNVTPNNNSPVQNPLVQSAAASHSNGRTAAARSVTVQTPVVKSLDTMPLTELKEEKAKRVETMNEKRAALAAVRNGQNEQVKEAKNQAAAAKENYEKVLKSDPSAKKYAKKIIKNNEAIEKNQTEIEKTAEDITNKEAQITDKENSISALEASLSGLESTLSRFPALTGKPEDKEKDAQITAKRNSLKNEISTKKKELQNQKTELAKMQKELEVLNKKKAKLEVERQKLEKEKAKLDELVNKNCSQAVKTALDAYNKASANYKAVKQREETKAMNAYNEAKTAVNEINAKISQKEAEAAADKYSTSDKTDKAVELAEAQVGVNENGSSNDSAEIRKYKNGSVDKNPWCASFVSWLYGAGQGSSNSETFGYTASSQSIKRKAIKAGCYASANSGYIPKKGDLAMWTKSSSTGHVGIVTKVYPDGSFDTVEGNSEDAVTKHHYDSQSSVGNGFNGFVEMDKWIA